MKLIKPVIHQSVSSFEVTPEASKEYNKKIQARFTNSVHTFCGSWYRLHKEGKVIAIFPGGCLVFSKVYIIILFFLGSYLSFWWWCRCVDWSHYKAVVPKGGMHWKKRSTSRNIVSGLSAFAAILLGFAAWQIRKA